MRPFGLLVLGLACGACALKPTYIEARGTLGDGTPFDVHLEGVVDGASSPWRAQAGGMGPGDLRGFWLWFDPSVKQGMSYPSTGSDTAVGPVHFFILRPLPDGGEGDNQASLVDGGTITFTAGGPDNYAGTLANLVLRRNAQTLATVDSGSFLAQRR